MRSSYTHRNRIMTAIAGSAVAAGAMLGGFAAAASASAEPAKTPSCLELVNPDGTINPAKAELGNSGCAPVDIYAPGLTLALRKAFVNKESPNYTRIIADLDAKFDESGNPRNGGYPVAPWDR